MRRILAVLVVLAAVIGLSRAIPARAASFFDITVALDGERWTVDCDKGCAWTRVSYACAGPCSVVVDSRGISDARDRRNDEVAFAFQLDRTERGWSATSVTGTAWTRLAWGCGPFRECKARVDASGVGPS